MKEKLNAYLELLEEISEKTDDEKTALALLQEISKDRRMEQIRQEQEVQNGSPATDNQKNYMEDLGVEFPEEITKKEASVLIKQKLEKMD